MKQLILFLLLIHPAVTRGDELKTVLAKLVVPGNGIIGAAFSPEPDLIFVQQNLMRATDGGMKISQTRRLSIWSIGQRAEILSRTLGVIPSGSNAVCGRIQVDKKKDRVFVCSDGGLDVLDSHSLADKLRIQSGHLENIFDFVFIEQTGVLAVLSLRNNSEIALSSYSDDGRLLNEQFLPNQNLLTMALEADQRSGEVAINLTHLYRMGNKSTIYVCGDSGKQKCRQVADTHPVGQMAFFGNQILLASQNPADDKKDCVEKFSEADTRINPAYCAPSSGVHFAVGVANRKYVVGFTGTSHYSALRQETTSTKSAFSIWRVEQQLPVKTIEDSTDYGSFQSSIRVVADEMGDRFLAFQRSASEISVYIIQ